MAHADLDPDLDPDRNREIREFLDWLDRAAPSPAITASPAFDGSRERGARSPRRRAERMAEFRM
jgi:hypothetical protein